MLKDRYFTFFARLRKPRERFMFSAE